MAVKRIKDHDLMTWETCAMSEVKKGDVFYTEDNGLKGPVLIAEDNAKQVPHPRHRNKMVWNVKTRPF